MVGQILHIRADTPQGAGAGGAGRGRRAIQGADYNLRTALTGQLKAAVFWDSDHTLAEPHVLLAQIYLERGDRAQALAYVQSALQIDPTNREALSLRRHVQAPVT